MSTIAEEFLAGDLMRRAQIAQRDDAREELARLLGDEALARYRTLSDRVLIAGRGHLSGKRHPFIFVPGVMGSLLRPNKLAGIWWIDARTAKKRMNDLRLSADGTADADPAFAVTPFAIDFSYDPFLTVCLEHDEFGAESFAYDWRKSLSQSTARLKQAIADMHSQTREPVPLVAHSLGGLLVRAMLATLAPDDWRMIGRIVFVATPHYGSASMAGYLKNHFWGMELLALLGLVLDRATFRSMRGPLSLLPAPLGVYPGTRGAQANEHPCANFDMYDAARWNLDLATDEQEHLQDVLQQVGKFHRDLYAAQQRLTREQLDRMLVIAGVGFSTLFRLEIGKTFLWETTDKVTRRIACDLHREGDGRVPLASALLENVEQRYVYGEHGGLANLQSVYEGIFDWLGGRPLRLAESCHGALASHLAPEDDLNLVPGNVAGDDPGFLLDRPLPAERAQALLDKLENGTLQGFERTRIF